MMKNMTNTLVFVFASLVVAGAGYFVTGIQQPATLRRFEDARRVADLQHAEVERLLLAEAQTAELAESSLRRWRARYKFVPAQMETPDVVQYIEGLTRRGFESIDIDLKSLTTRPDYSFYTFEIRGTAFFVNLHDFVWHIENNREFYHIRNLSLSHVDILDENPETGIDRRLSMVNFTMEMDAFFAGAEGLSAPADGLLPIPVSLLPIHYPAHNSFYPLIRADRPPNDRLLADVEKARLISIIGNRAILEDENGRHGVGVGDSVYLGEIIEVDPVNVVVTARLNIGGVEKTVSLYLEAAGAPHEQAKGDVQLRPIDNN